MMVLPLYSSRRHLWWYKPQAWYRKLLFITVHLLVLIQIYNLFSVFLLFRPASLQIWDVPDLLHFDVESTNPWPIRENLRTFPTFLPSFLACASAVFEKQPSPLHLSLAICWCWVSCEWRLRFSLFTPNYLNYSVLGVKTSRLLFLHPLFTSFSAFPIFPSRPRPRPALWPFITP